MRPTGVTVLSVLFAIFGILAIIGGAMVMNVVSVVAGLIDLAVAYGLWSGREWGRILTIILCAIGILWGLLVIVATPFMVAMMHAPMLRGFAGILTTSLLAGALIGIVVNAVIIYYLTRPHVKSYFR